MFMEREMIFGTDVARKVALLAVSPLDGRYANVGEKLNEYFSEYALIKHRVEVEILWLQYVLTEVKNIPNMDTALKRDLARIASIAKEFSLQDAIKVKDIEKNTNHDVKAVEYFIDQKLVECGLQRYVSFVHIGCTSEDINNTSYGLMLGRSLLNVWIPAATRLIQKVKDLAREYAKVPMLAHTHGQPATPTTVGKEFAVYVYRLEESLKQIQSIKCKGKFNGATGNYSAISTAFSDEDWPALCRRFIEDYLGLEFNPMTTQIESHDYMAHLFDAMRHFNNVVLDMNVDMWLYISMEYFKQTVVKGEVGSSVMPHKVNPIRFENSEANIDISNAFFTALSNKLVRSRMQRDLSDSSSQRNIGCAFGYSLLSLEQTLSGLNRVTANKETLMHSLDTNWEVLAEPIQTMLRKYGIEDAYEQLKELTRGKSIGKEDIQQFVNTLDAISEEDKKILLLLTPDNYIGRAADLVGRI